MPDIFVDRERELKRLTINTNLVKKGEGRVVLIEGPAGIGKTALIDKFLESILSFEVLRGECDVNSKYVAYSVFSRALKNYGDLKDIRNNVERRKALDYAQDLVVRPRMVMVDEIERGAGYFLYQNISSEIPGIFFTSRKPEDGGIWLTETTTDMKSVNPNNLEFTLLPAVIDFLQKGNEGKAVYIDDLNYLIYLNGIDTVVNFLHALYSLVMDRNVIILSGKLEHLDEEEKNKIMNAFDEIVSFHLEERPEKPMSYLVDTSALENIKNAAVFSTKRGSQYVVGIGDLVASRLEFEIFETIKKEVESERDIVIDCLQYLIHHHGVRRIYIWLKAIVDYAVKFGRKIYITTRGLTPLQQDLIQWLVDESEVRKEYKEIEKKQTVRFYNTILNFLDYNSKKKPILLILDNLQWADISSLELLKYLVRNISKTRIMILGAYRGEELAEDEEASEIFENIIRYENSEIIRLRKLPPKAIEEIVRFMGKVDEDVIKIIYEKSEGNPLMAISMLNYVNSQRYVLPETIRESVEMELEKIDDRTLKLLKIISAFGTRADIKIIESIMPDYSKLIKRIEGKFIKVEDSKLSFVHNIYRDVVYEYASRDERRKIHRELGERFEKIGDKTNAAYQYYMAKDRRALELLMEVAEEYIRNMAVRNAIEYYNMSMEIARKYGMNKKIYELYERLGNLYMFSGDYMKALEMYQESLKNGNPKNVELTIKIAKSQERMGNFHESLNLLMPYMNVAKNRSKAELLLEVGVIKWHLGEFDGAVEYLNRALKKAKKLDNYKTIADTYRNMAIVYYYKSDYKTALQYAKKGMEYAIKYGDYDLLANSYNVIGALYSSMGMNYEAIEYYKKYLGISQKLGNYDYISKAYNNLFVAYSALGEYQKGKEYYIKSFEISLKVGNPRDLGIAYNNMAVIEAQDGSYTRALEYMEKSLKYLEEIGDEYLLCDHMVNLGNFLFEIEKYKESENILKRALKIAVDNGYRVEEIRAKTGLISLYADIKKYKDAERIIAEVDDIFQKEKIEDLESKIAFLSSKAYYYMEVGKFSEAEKATEEAMDIAKKINDESSIVGVQEYMARIRCRLEDYNTAIQYFEEAIDYWKKMSVKKDMADTYRRYAECLENIDKREALKYYRLAREIYRQMDIDNLVEKMDKKIKSLGG